MDADEYQKLALRTESTPTFCNDFQFDDDLQMSRIIHAAMGISTESGEVMDILKKHFIYRKPIELSRFADEIGDLMWYCALMLDACGYSFPQVMEANIAKLKARFGDKFSADAALSKDRDAEQKALEGALNK